jgi:hypothetical protein
MGFARSKCAGQQDTVARTQMRRETRGGGGGIIGAGKLQVQGFGRWHAPTLAVHALGRKAD